MSQIAAFHEDGGPVLPTEHAHEPGAAQPTVAALGGGDHRAMESGGVEVSFARRRRCSGKLERLRHRSGA